MRTLLEAGEKGNSRLWRAILNPAPLLRQPMARSYARDSAEEVQLALKHVLPPWQCTPGAMDMLVKYVGGEAPNYDAAMDSRSY